LLAKLQAAAQTPGKAQVASASFPDRRSLVAQAFRSRSKATERPQMASIQPGQMQPRTGLCIDYETVNASLTNYTFASDTNYYISSGVSLRGTNNIIQGGTVIKFTNSTSAKLNFLDAGLVCKTGPYKMAILTSKDDNSVGETISGSTGSPTNYPGATYLYAPGGAVLPYLKFCYAGT